MSVQARHTRCPQCKTRFRVTEEQLTVAAGKVRCGQCRTIFNARAHLVSDPPPEDSGTRPPSGETPSPFQHQARDNFDEPPISARLDAGPEEDDDELIFEDDPDEDATENNYAGRNQKLESELSSSFLSLDEEARAGWRDDSGTDPDEPSIDESWAESLLDEDDSSRGPYKGSEEAPASQEAPTSPSTPASPEEDDWEAMIDWDSLDNLPDIPDPASQVQPPSREKVEAGPAARTPPPSSRARADDKGGLSLASGPEKGSAPERGRATGSPPRREPGTDWRQLRAEPVTPRKSRREASSHRGLWSGVALLLVVLLGGQLLWVQKEALARNPHLRPLYVQACEWFDCQLPHLVDRSQLVSRDLVVRNHPEQNGALLVEARLHNRAPFPQPLPAVALSFSNLNGDIVAQRVFRPSEYLARENTPEEIGPNRALPIRLSLQDPGREAINYRLDFLGMPE